MYLPSVARLTLNCCCKYLRNDAFYSNDLRSRVISLFFYKACIYFVSLVYISKVNVL